MIYQPRTYTQDEIFLKEIELERWRIRLEAAAKKYNNAMGHNYISAANEWCNIRGVFLGLEHTLEHMRKNVKP